MLAVGAGAADQLPRAQLLRAEQHGTSLRGGQVTIEATEAVIPTTAC